MTLNAEEKISIETEESLFNEVRQSISRQIVNAEDRLYRENQRARALTSEIHETRRIEDKALLASDEAVSHGLKDNKREEVENLRKQLSNPYFARIKLEEEGPNGSTTTIEYKLGFSANTDLRIIDWRKAPISKLYYEYQEGNEYVEEILGRERIGKVALRTRIEVARGTLKTIQNRYGTFSWNTEDGIWESQSSGARRSKDSAGNLPEILSLITAEQFRSITVDANTAILIQGIAGSGKTTVALHRLAWIMHKDNSPLTPKDCGFIVLSPALRTYITNSLPSVGISDVTVRTYHEWSCRTFKSLPDGKSLSFERPTSPTPINITKLKRSAALLKTLENFAMSQRDIIGKPLFADLQNQLLKILASTDAILASCKGELIQREDIEATYRFTTNSFTNGILDWDDDALLLRLLQVYTGGVLTEKNIHGKYGHMFVDEVQDLSPVELATIFGSVQNHKDLTLVGDTSQNLDATASFPGWDALRKHWNLTNDMSQYISLEVSHRSTLPIMRFADYIQRRDIVKTGRAGRTPIWFKCRDESQGIENVLKWVTKAGELYPTKLVAIICASPHDAQFAYKMLQPTFGLRVRKGDAHSFSFEEGILVTDVRQVKGLEFHSVLIWNPNSDSYPNTDISRNLLYVAATRAEENLCLVTWDYQAKALPPFGSSRLIRSMDMTIVDEQEEDITDSDD